MVIYVARILQNPVNIHAILNKVVSLSSKSATMAGLVVFFECEMLVQNCIAFSGEQDGESKIDAWVRFYKKI